MVNISAVVCTYNRYDLLVKALDSLVAQTLPDREYEIIVVDNTPGAEDGNGAVIADKYKNVSNLKYLFEKTPGLSNARNVAMNIAKGQYISYLDDDAVAVVDWLERIVEGFETFSDVGVVGGLISPLWEVERPKWLDNRLTGYVSVVDWGGELRIAAESEWFAGANISFDRKLLVDSGGFSTALGRVGSGNSLMSNEEIQVLDYIKSQGAKAVYAPKAKVDHLVEKKRLARSWFRRRVAWQATSDFVMDAETQEARLAGCLKNLKGYIASLPPLSRNLQGLHLKTDDPDQFVWQLSAIYDYTILALAGFSGVPESE